jgi:hypothetical protein
VAAWAVTEGVDAVNGITTRRRPSGHMRFRQETRRGRRDTEQWKGMVE